VKRKKILKIAIASVSVFLLALIGGAVLLYNFYPVNSVLSMLSAMAEKELKRGVSIDALEYSLRGIVLHKLKLHNGPGDCPGILASADDAVIRFSLPRLVFKKEFDINFIHIIGLDLAICYKDGTSNLENLITDLTAGEQSSVAARLDTIKLTRARISLKNPPSSLKPLEGEYSLNGLLDFTGDQSFRLSDATIVLPEKRGAVRPDITIKTPDGGFQISGEVLLEHCSLKWVYRWGTDLSLPYQDFSGRVTGLVITRNSVEGSVRGTSNLPGDRPLLVNGFCRVNIAGESVFISNIRGSVLSTSFLIDEFLFDFDGNIKKFSIRDIDARIDDVRPILSFLPGELSGTAKGVLSLGEAGYSGLLNIDASYGSGEALLKNARATIKINNNRIEPTGIRASLFNQPVDITLASLDGSFRRFRADASCAAFSLPAEPRKGQGAKSTGPSPFAGDIPIEVSGTVSVGALTLGELSFGKTSAGYSFARKRLQAGPIQTEFMGGEIRARATVDFGSPAVPLECSASFERLRVQNISRMSERFKDRMFGLASGNVEIGFSLSERIDLRKSFRGRMEFTIDRGKLVDTGIQNGLGILLSDLKYKLKDLEFSKIYGNLTIAGSDYQINSFLFSAPEIRLRLDGHINNELEGDLKIDLEFTRQFIQDLPNPVLLQLGKYKRDRWYVIPFQSKGKDVTDSKNIVRLQ